MVVPQGAAASAACAAQLPRALPRGRPDAGPAPSSRGRRPIPSSLHGLMICRDMSAADKCGSSVTDTDALKKQCAVSRPSSGCYRRSPIRTRCRWPCSLVVSCQLLL
jgi:hypothetical protein